MTTITVIGTGNMGAAIASVAQKGGASVQILGRDAAKAADVAARMGAASGVVAGLVAITPACGSLSPVGSIILGAVSGALCALAVGLKYKFGFDDALDVVGVHLVGGLVGTVGIGFLATSGGLFYGDGFKLLVVQVVIALFAMVWSAVFTFVASSENEDAMKGRRPVSISKSTTPSA